MKISGWARLACTVLLVAFLAGCGRGPDEVEKVVSEPKTYVGSEQCKMCHLEHYDSWRGTTTPGEVHFIVARFRT
ncbi:MAG: hypothetical protein JRD00_11145 [Deltaproteobacteria bacterium]|nr:hypothetical protein [Deltaproteobacteria bacterium]